MALADVKKVKSVTRYEPGPLPPNVKDLGVYIITELNRLGGIMFNQSVMRLEQSNVAPDKPRIGDIRYADGTNWDPGSGEGIYFRNSAGNWVKL